MTADYIDVVVELGTFRTARWRDHCLALWYARAATMPIRRLHRRTFATRRPAWTANLSRRSRRPSSWRALAVFATVTR
jgi:hypothetical protein